jgi:hypothetical protein
MIREFFRPFFKRISDIVYQGRNNAFIWIGSDRKDIVESGYGDEGRGEEGSSAIGLVVGLSRGDGNLDYKNDLIHVYLSAKTDPDDYFGVTTGGRVQAEPAAVVKAQNVYLVAPGKIKFINGEHSIVLSSDGIKIISNNISLECDKAEVVSSGDILLKSPDIMFDSGGAVPRRIITEDDICVGADPLTGPILSSFKAPGAVIFNSKVKIK